MERDGRLKCVEQAEAREVEGLTLTLFWAVWTLQAPRSQEPRLTRTAQSAQPIKNRLGWTKPTSEPVRWLLYWN